MKKLLPFLLLACGIANTQIVTFASPPLLEGLTWNYSNLIPFESRSVFVTLNVNLPVETPAVNIDDVLTFGAIIKRRSEKVCAFFMQ